jgi:hypothetical protein
MSSKIIDIVLKNREKMKEIEGKDKKKVRFERKLSTYQKDGQAVADELRDRLLDFFYIKSGRDKSKTQNVYSTGGKIQFEKKGKKFSIQEVKEKYMDIDYAKPLNELINPFKKSSDVNEQNS